MRTALQVTEKIAELSDEVTAIIDVAAKEERELTDDETTRIDAIQGKGDDSGEIGKLEEERERLQKIENRRKVLAAQRGRPGTDGASHDGALDNPQGLVLPNGDVNMAAVRVPYKDRPRSMMKAFTKDRCEHPEKEAYIAGLFYAAAIWGHEDARNKLDNMGIQMQQTVGDPTKGGFAVPEILESTIIRLVELYGVFRRFTRVMPMGPGTLSLPRRTSGITAYFTAELAAITESDFTGDNIVLTAQKLASLTRWSTELPEDASAQIGDLMTQEIATAFSLREDQVGFQGDGTATDGNITGLETALLASSRVVTPAGETSFGAVTSTAFEEAVAKLPEFPGINAAWYCHKSVWANCMQRIALAAGGNTIQNWEAGMGPNFLGYPVRFAQVLPRGLQGTAQADLKGFCYFGDLAMSSTMGDKRGITISTDMGGKYFETDAIAVKGRERFDIKNHETGTATATDPAGPMIALDLAAA